MCPPTPSAPPLLHPRRDEHGRPVLIHQPSIASPLEQWLDPSAIAVAVPDGPLVETLNGIPFTRQSSSAPWPGDVWRQEACCFDEPPFEPPAGLAPAAGPPKRTAGTLADPGRRQVGR